MQTIQWNRNAIPKISSSDSRVFCTGRHLCNSLLYYQFLWHSVHSLFQNNNFLLNIFKWKILNWNSIWFPQQNHWYDSKKKKKKSEQMKWFARSLTSLKAFRTTSNRIACIYATSYNNWNAGIWNLYWCALMETYPIIYRLMNLNSLNGFYFFLSQFFIFDYNEWSLVNPMAEYVAKYTYKFDNSRVRPFKTENNGIM